MRAAEGHWILGEAAAAAGDLTTAERELTASLDALVPAAISWQTAAARLVAVRLALGQAPEALALSRTLHASVTAAGHGLRGTLVRLVHAEALHVSGDRDAARAALAEAQADLATRAARIDDPDVRRRFLEAVPENARVTALASVWQT
jgi:hypothetical protein